MAVHPAGELARYGNTVHFLAGSGVEIELRLNGEELEYSALYGPAIEEVRLLDGALPLEPGAQNYYAIPQRLGILIPVEGDRPFHRRLAGYRAYSMAMLGAVKSGSAILVSRDEPTHAAGAMARACANQPEA